MQRKSRSIALVFVLALSVFTWSGSSLFAQAPLPTPQQLDQLLAPIALYPDSLLAQITTASTNPQEILDVSNWLLQNPGLQGAALTDAAEKQGFDAAFVALVTFPDVLNVMAEHVDDYAAIGQAFSADQGAVSASIQRLRAQAYAAGNLQSNQQQQVQVQQTAAQPVYVIQPANPQVVYVPVYNPTVVYVRPPTNVVVVSYGPPIPIGILMVSRPWGWMGWGWNWSSRRCYYNHTVWVGWGNPYRPPNVWYRPRPIPYNSRPGYGGNWHYHPPNYRPPTLVKPPVNRPPWGPNNRPGNGYRPPANRPGTGRPPVQQPKPRPTQPSTRPTQPSTRPTQPSTRPTQPSTRPTQPSTRPTQPNTKPAQPNTRPTQPSTKPSQPNTKPAQPRPAPPNPRPAPPNNKPPQKQPSGSRPPPQPKPNNN